MLPVELVRHPVQKTDDIAQVVLELRIDRELFWFNGHFTGQPILPGVAQLDWVMRYAAELLAPQWRFSAIENIKFQCPVLPDKVLRLALTWHEARQRLSFSYHLVMGDEAIVASSGKIKLALITVPAS